VRGSDYIEPLLIGLVVYRVNDNDGIRKHGLIRGLFKRSSCPSYQAF
jgi:hypothetical protein